MSEPLLSVVVTCMGRLHHLKLTAPPLLAQPEVEYILVDYSCPDRCGDYARVHWPQAQVVSISGERFFNKPRALNAGASAARGRWLVQIDADNLVRPDFARTVLSLVAEDVLVAHRAPNYGTGFMACSPRVYAAAGGYDTRFDGWGPEDMEMRQRLLKLGLKLRLVPDDLIQVIEHDDADRTRFYAVQDKVRSGRRLAGRLTFRLPLEYRVPWHDPVTFGVPYPNWLSVWRTVQYAHYIRRLMGGEVRLYPHWEAPDGACRLDYGELMREIDALLDAEPLEVVVAAPPASVERYHLREHWHFPLTPTRVRWLGWGDAASRRLAYCLPDEELDAAPGKQALERLGCEPVAVSPDWPLQRLATTLAESVLYVGIGNRVAHVGYAVGTPVFVLQDCSDAAALFADHGDRAGFWCRDLKDFVRKARQLLGANVAPAIPRLGRDTEVAFS